MRRRGCRKRVLGTRAPMVIPMAPNARWDSETDAYAMEQRACGFSRRAEPRGSGSDARRSNSGRPGWPKTVLMRCLFRTLDKPSTGLCDKLLILLKKMARPKGFEPLTPRFVVWCSIQLSYGRAVPNGFFNPCEMSLARQGQRLYWLVAYCNPWYDKLAKEFRAASPKPLLRGELAGLRWEFDNKHRAFGLGAKRDLSAIGFHKLPHDCQPKARTASACGTFKRHKEIFPRARW